MGWSCRVEVSEKLNAWKAVCMSQTGMSNMFRRNGIEYFFELDSVEYPDGSATGTLMKMTDEEHCVQLAVWKIDPTGNVSSEGPVPC